MSRATPYILLLAAGMLGLVSLAFFSVNSIGSLTLLSSSSSSSSSSSHSYSEDTRDTPLWLRSDAKRSSDFLLSTTTQDDGLPDSCNPVTRVRQLISAFNDARFDDLTTFYTEDALRFVNGVLDPASGGHPYTEEQWIELRARQPMRIKINALTRSSEFQVAATTDIFVGGADEPARSAGLGFIFEFRHSDRCLVQAERLFYGHDSEAAERYNEASCEVFEPLRMREQCTGVAATAAPGAPAPAVVDLEARLRACWGHVDDGNAVGIAACYRTNAVVTANGVAAPDEQLWLPSFWTQRFNAISYEQINFQSIDVDQDRLTLNTVVQLNLLSKLDADNQALDALIYQTFVFNAGGEVLEYHYIMSEAVVNFLRRLQGLGPDASLWTVAAARAAVGPAFAALGDADHFSNAGGGADSALWYPSTLTARPSTPLEGVYLYDAETSVNMGGGTTLKSVMYCSAPLTVSPALVDDVREVSKTILYDELAKRIWSRGSSIGHCMVDFYHAGLVAKEGFSLATAQDTLVANIEASADTTSAFYAQMTAKLPTLLN